LKLYDISQEVFGCKVYPGDPTPKREVLSSIEEGALYNLTAFSMCAHNGTHIDAPCHFIKGGKTVDEIPLEKTVGKAYVTEFEGVLSKEDAEKILKKAERTDRDAAKKLLIKGKATVSSEAARVFAEAKIDLIGNESQTVGPFNAPMEVHLTLLGAEVVLLEGIRLNEVSEGVYFLNAAPLSLGDSDGAPCRAYLVKE
jgi:arylformamidase